MSFLVQDYVRGLPLPSTVKFVAMMLAWHAHDDGCEARPSQETLADEVSITVRHVRRCLKELLEKGIISVQRPPGKGRCTVYQFPEPPSGFGRTSESLGRTSTTVWADTQVPLTIKNSHDKKIPYRSAALVRDPRRGVAVSADEMRERTRREQEALRAKREAEGPGVPMPISIKAWRDKMSGRASSNHPQLFSDDVQGGQL